MRYLAIVSLLLLSACESTYFINDVNLDGEAVADRSTEPLDKAIVVVKDAEPLINDVVYSIEKHPEIILNHEVLFKLDSVLLTNDAKLSLDTVYKVSVDHPNLVISITGHTDVKGGYYYNQELSMNRSIAVRYYLNSLGLKNTTVIQSRGKLKLKCNAVDEEAMKCNRRVEIKII